MIDSRTTAQRWADSVTEFSGSWAFIGLFALVCLSTFQNPLILLSQNRQNEMDRERVNEILSKLDELQRTVDELRRERGVREVPS